MKWSLPLLFGGLTLASICWSQTAETRSLRAVLADINRKADVYAVAVSLLADEPVVGPDLTQVDASNVLQHLKKIAASLPFTARVIKLSLPKGPSWTAEELLDYSRAEATLFRKPLRDTNDDLMEVMRHEVSKENREAVTQALDLRTVYVIALKQANFGGFWETTYGMMRLEQTGTSVVGTYSVNGGEIRGTVVGTQLRFTWFEQDNGTSGSGAVDLSDDGMTFSGPWWNSNNPTAQAGVWSGKRIRKTRSKS